MADPHFHHHPSSLSGNSLGGEDHQNDIHWISHDGKNQTLEII
jgi:hypothetical protein